MTHREKADIDIHEASRSTWEAWDYEDALRKIIYRLAEQLDELEDNQDAIATEEDIKEWQWID